MTTVFVKLPWWRCLTGCWPEGIVGRCGRPEAGLRPYRVLYERFNPDNPYLYRWRIWPWLTWLTLGLVRAHLHRIVRPDDDPDSHDHPWGFWFGWILEGGYWEDQGWRWSEDRPNDPDHGVVFRAQGRFFWHGRHLHRIAELHAEESWSLVFMGPRVREWGFVDRVTGCWTRWRNYIEGERC